MRSIRLIKTVITFQSLAILKVNKLFWVLGVVGWAVSTPWAEPKTDSPGDIEAAERKMWLEVCHLFSYVVITYNF